jgi:2-phosphosulfolactate phosphatase
MASFDQAGFEVRFEWGVDGAQEVGRGARAIIVVDILRFTTTVDAAVSRRAVIYPYRWRDDSAVSYAASLGAALAGLREDATSENPFTLSPLSMATAHAETRIVLPSPNGAEVSLAAASTGAHELTGCLRNVEAVAAAALAIGPPIGVMAAGERWKSDSALRPSFEDLLGAGAIVRALGSTKASPEGQAAAAVFDRSRDLERLLWECSSGRELTQKGFFADVVWASRLNVSRTAPRLLSGTFVG